MMKSAHEAYKPRSRARRKGRRACVEGWMDGEVGVRAVRFMFFASRAGWSPASVIRGLAMKMGASPESGAVQFR